MIDPARDFEVERRPPGRLEPLDKPRVEPPTAPSRFPAGSARFGHAPPGLAKQLASGAVEFSDAHTRRAIPPPIARRRRVAAAIARRLLMLFAASFAIALATWVVLQLVAQR